MDRRFWWFVTPKLAVNLPSQQPISTQSLPNARISAKLPQARISLLHTFGLFY